MNHTHYLFAVEHTYSTKNRLQKAVLEYFKKMDRIIIPASEIDKFKTKIIEDINEFNSKFKACKAIYITFSPGHPYKQDVMIHGFDAAVPRFRVGVEVVFGLEYKSVTHN